jgi:hypothetical protein
MSRLKWVFLQLSVWVHRHRTLLAVAAVAISLLLASSEAWARIGGGQGYSRGGGGSSRGGSRGGGGGGGEAELFIFLIHLCIQHPSIGVPLVLVLGAIMVVRHFTQSDGSRWTAHTPTQNWKVERPGSVRRRSRAVMGMNTLRKADHGFSMPVLLDFLVLVHRRAHGALSTGSWSALRPFVSEAGQKALKVANRGVETIDDLIVGSARVTRVAVRGGYTWLDISYTSTRREAGAGKARVVQVEERWAYRRKNGAVSLEPDAVQRLGCPSCGNAVECDAMGACTHCDSPITAGQLQWQLHGVQLVRRAPAQVPQVGLLKGGAEASVQPPTLVDIDLQPSMRRLLARHPDFRLKTFLKRADYLYHELQSAWSALDPARLRPHVTDPMFQWLRFWVDNHERNGLRNVLEDVKLERCEVARIEVDAWYEAVTVRIWGSMKDSTVDASSKVVGGNARVARRFSEYWTFLRASGTGGTSHADDRCPSCGAPLDNVNAAGVCGYCDSKLSTGKFDWVLSRIEQVEAYDG